MNVFEKQIGCPPNQFFNHYLNRFIGDRPPENGPYQPYQALMIGGLLLAGEWQDWGENFRLGMLSHVVVLALGQIINSSRPFFSYSHADLAHRNVRLHNLPTILFVSCDLFTSAYRSFSRQCYTSSSDHPAKRLYHFIGESRNWVGLALSYTLLKQEGAIPFKGVIAGHFGWIAATLFDPLFLLYSDKQWDQVVFNSLFEFFISSPPANELDDRMNDLAQKIDFILTEKDQTKKWEELNQATRDWLRNNHPDKNLNNPKATKETQEVNGLRSELMKHFR